MKSISLFYIDSKEIEILFAQNFKDIEKKVITKEEGAIDANLKFGTTGFFNRIISSEIVAGGTTNNSITEETNVKNSLYDKIAALIDKYPIEELSANIEDGMVICISDYFILYRIDTENNVYEQFDHMPNFTYIMNRIRNNECVYTFETNKFALSNAGYETKNPNANSIILKIQSSKLVKEIHHYSEKIGQYVPFHFNIIGEINIIKDGYTMKPFLIWR